MLVWLQIIYIFVKYSISGMIVVATLLASLSSCEIKKEINSIYSWNKDSTRFQILDEKTIPINLIEVGLLQEEFQLIRQRGPLETTIPGYESARYQLFGDEDTLRGNLEDMYIWQFDSKTIQGRSNLRDPHQVPVRLKDVNRANDSIIWQKTEPLSNSLFLEPTHWFAFIINPEDSLSGFFEGNWQIRNHPDSVIEQFGALSGFISRKHDFHFLTDTTSDFYRILGNTTSGELRLKTIYQIDSLNTTYTFDSLATEGQVSYQYFLLNETDTDSSYLKLNLRKQ